MRLILVTALFVSFAFNVSLAASKGHETKGPGITTRTHGYFRQLRFSPNGRLILAQNERTIFVLRSDPLSLIFEIPAEDASDAEFTPDSNRLFFVGSVSALHADAVLFALMAYRPRAEMWDVAGRIQTRSQPLPLNNCGTDKMSPDGMLLACVNNEGELLIIDVSSGNVIFYRKRFTREYLIYGSGSTPLPVDTGGHPGDAIMDYSSDSKFFLASPYDAEGRLLAVNIQERVEKKPTHKLTRDARPVFAFLGPDLILMSHEEPLTARTVEASLVEFSTGVKLTSMRLPPGPLYRASDPDFIINRPFGRFAQFKDPNATRAAAINLRNGRLIVSDRPAIDVLAPYYVGEPDIGVVGLYEIGKGLIDKLVTSAAQNP